MKIRVDVAAFLLCVSLPGLAQSIETKPSADQVVATMLARNSQRESQSSGYTGTRQYVFYNHKLNKRAEMLVSVTCDPDGTKSFSVLSEDGWKSADKHVFRKMLESESESSQPTTREESQINSKNYSFETMELTTVENRPTYVIDVVPKRRDKYLFRGKIWVDAEDYALVRAEGEPAKNPSFWTRHVRFVQQYKKAGAFWFPVSTTSVTDAFIFGTTDVSIRYFDYAPVSHTAHRITTSPFTEASYASH